MAKQPLPRSKWGAKWHEQGHAGLWYEKLGGAWKDDWSLKADRDGVSPKLDWMRPLLSKPVGSSKLLKEHAGRQKDLAKRLGGRLLELENRSAFVTGLGQAHPIENGFLWHPSLGVPYLPGSGAKGVLRSWLKMEGPELATGIAKVADGAPAVDPPDETEIDRLLGTKVRVGAIDLLPLLPTRPVSLQADLVNPHHGAYQRGGEWPADWQDPVPSFFLSVAPRSLWQIAVVPGRGAGPDDVDRAAGWLIQAADWIGFGAKTAVGYGRFREL